MATSPFPFPYHAAATYHHPSPIGFPTAYTPASTVFPPPPHAPTPIVGHQIGCYPLPFSSYPAPASGVFPTPAYDAPPAFPCSPPSTPCSTPFPFGSSPDHAYGHGFITTQASQTAYCPNQPPPLPVPATSEFSGDFSSWSPLCSRPMLQQQKEEGGKTDDGKAVRFAMHKFRCRDGDLSKGTNTSGASVNGKRLVHKQPGPEILSMANNDSKPQQYSQVNNTATNQQYSQASAPALLESAEAQAQAEATKDVSRAVLDLKRRLDAQLARDRTSFDTIKGELAKLTSMAAQLAVSIGKQATSATPGSSPLGVICTAPVAPKVFDTMPTPSSGYENFSGHPNQSSCVHSGRTNLRKQNLDEMPQSYGFNNLSRQSLFLADGTERSYYVLPEDYPLEQATKPMSPPAEKHVGVMVPPSVAAHAADVAPVLGFKANNTAGYESLLVPNLQLSMKVQDAPNVFKGMPVYDIYEEEDSGCLNITSDVRDFSFELQQQEDEKACNCPVLKASDSTVTSSNHLSIDHSMRELRLLWDPGASAFLVTPLKNDSSNIFSYHGKTDLWSQSEHQFIVFRAVFEKLMLDIPLAKPPDWYGSVDSSPVNVHLRAPPLNVLVIHEKRNEWDRDRKFHTLFMTAADATKLQCTDVYKFGLVHILAVQFGAKRELISESAIMCSCAFGFGWTEVNAAAVLVLLVPCPKGSYVAKHSMFLSYGGTSITKRYSPKLLMQLFCAATTVQVTEQRQPLKFSLIVAILPNESEFRDEQLAYMCQGTSINYSDWVMHKVQYCCLQIVLAGPYYVPVYYSSKFSSTSTIISTRCMSTASMVHMILVLASGKPIQEEKGSIAVYQVSKTQIPMSKTSHIWDPGTMLLLYKSKWWLLYTEENTNWHKDIKCYGVALWLIHYQPP